jgi:hypothetical protein
VGLISEQTRDVTAMRTGKGNSRSAHFAYENLGRLGQGEVGVIERIKVLFGKKHSRILAYKIIEGLREDPEFVQHLIDTHSFLMHDPILSKYALPTFRLAEDGFIMSDLSNNGENIVFSWNEHQEAEKKRLLAEHPDLSERLGAVSIDSIKQQIVELASRAAEKGLQIGDSIFMVVHPDGACRLYIADLDNVQILSNYDHNELLRSNMQDITHVVNVKDWLMK